MADRKRQAYQVMVNKETHRKLKGISTVMDMTMGELVTLLVNDIDFRKYGITSSFWNVDKDKKEDMLEDMKARRKKAKDSITDNTGKENQEG